ncbi:DUF6801 domain-containing protein [Streptomyces beijiangensis]|uniref:DUF6801 domain-containing protein n=1 Tax=Streptomyces beijiangensis TaxID=163361 RepID=A0A939F6Z0_9ACTN|nr:DUF6801 domain-containing protein [Streptomyces beijiangensis]MBO0512738.1 hypothetical protein [Streptomyces beijiangensis]
MDVRYPAGRNSRSVRVASVAAAAMVAGLLSGGGSAADEGNKEAGTAAPVTIEYDCKLPSGAVRAAVRIAAAYPESGEAGRPMDPGPVTVGMSLPRSGLGAALPPDTTVVQSTATLAVQVAQNGRTAEAQWNGLAAPGAPVPPQGDLELSHQGAVPTVTVNAPGVVALTAGRLTVEVKPLVASEDKDPGAGLTFSCDPAAGESGRFATVTVPGATESSSPTGSPTSDDPGGKQRKGIALGPQDGPVTAAEKLCKAPLPKGKLDASEAPPAPKLPDGRVPTEYDVGAGMQTCSYAVGLANVRKLNGAMIINDPQKKPVQIGIAAMMHTAFREPDENNEGYYMRFDSLGQLDLPDAESTFLAFGFEPVSAKVRFENGPITVSTGNIGADADAGVFSTAYFKQSLRLYDVKVNGVPLDVGKNCGTSRPFKVVLNGGARYPNVFAGGILEGDVTIPSFSGCGTGGENLNSLFTAQISGPGNHVVMNQGNACVQDQPDNTPCPPLIPALPTSLPKAP